MSADRESADDRFPRARAFEREVVARCSTRVEPFAFGTAYLNEDLPRRYSSNVLWVDAEAGRPKADALVAEAERVLGGAGLAHREIVADDETGSALAPGFLELGWSVERLVLMTLEREPIRRPATGVRATDFQHARPLIEEVTRRAPYGDDEEVVRQLVEHKRVLEHAIGARFFVARSDERPASVCELYAIEDVAQVEDVNTLEEFRGQGLASAVVMAAARSARAAGARLVFLVADEGDWPKHLYRKLGFDEAGCSWAFLRAPS